MMLREKRLLMRLRINSFINNSSYFFFCLKIPEMTLGCISCGKNEHDESAKIAPAEIEAENYRPATARARFFKIK